jgi:cytochrome c-type protein NapC
MATALVVLALAAAAYFVARPAFAGAGREGRSVAFLALLVLPVLAGLAGLGAHLEASKQTSYCVSCHAMKPYQRSLHLDDVEHLAATHYQNARVPRETACFACHTDYTIYGDLHDKLRGMRHLWTQYVSGPRPKLALYRPYNNRECLHCHGGARSFEEAATHRAEPGRLTALRENKASCMESGCHAVVHDVGGTAGAAARRDP